MLVVLPSDGIAGFPLQRLLDNQPRRQVDQLVLGRSRIEAGNLIAMVGCSFAGPAKPVFRFAGKGCTPPNCPANLGLRQLTSACCGGHLIHQIDFAKFIQKLWIAMSTLTILPNWERHPHSSSTTAPNFDAPKQRSQTAAARCQQNTKILPEMRPHRDMSKSHVFVHLRKRAR